jgi:hypothetical protein
MRKLFLFAAFFGESMRELSYFLRLASRSRLLRIPGQRKSLPLRYAEAGFLIA